MMGNIAVVGWIWLSLQTGTSTGTEIPIGIISGLTGVLTGKKLAEYEFARNQPTEPLKKVAVTATEAQKAVDAVEHIKDIVKK